MIDIIFRYIIIGILSAYLLIYGLRPAIPYPETIIDLYEHYWIIIVIIIIDYYIIMWDLRIGILIALCIIGLVFDMMTFGN
jgi:hypothetical protein